MAPTPSLGLFALAVVVAVSSAASEAERYRVGGPDGWRVPAPEDQEMYVKWASGITFYVEDSIEFVYKDDSVMKVAKVGYYHCNETAAIGGRPRDGITVFLLDRPGYAYFASGDLEHCKKGQRLMVDVQAKPTASSSSSSVPAPAPQPSAAAASASLALCHHVLACVTLALFLCFL